MKVNLAGTTEEGNKDQFRQGTEVPEVKEGDKLRALNSF